MNCATRQTKFFVNNYYIVGLCSSSESVVTSSSPGPYFFQSQLSMKFPMLIKTKILKNKDFFAFKLSDVLFIMLTTVKMPKNVGILTFMSMTN